MLQKDKWNPGCSRKIDAFQPHVNDIIEFLSEIYNSGIDYTSVCMGQTALNTIVTQYSKIFWYIRTFSNRKTYQRCLQHTTTKTKIYPHFGNK